MTIYRWSLSTVNPDDVCRALWRVAAVIWDDDPNRITFQLNSTVVELFDHPLPTLLISGPTDGAVSAVAGQLGYPDIDETIMEVKDTVIEIKHEVGAR
jgi:hypothetical protein